MSGPIGVDRAGGHRIRSITEFESDRTHEPADPWKEQFGITHARLDFKGGHAEVAQVRRVTEIPEHEHGTQRHEERPKKRVRVIRQTPEDRIARRG